MYAPVELLFPHHVAAETVVFKVTAKDGAWDVRREALPPEEPPAGRPRKILGVEIESADPIGSFASELEQIRSREQATESYCLVRTRSQLAAVLRLLRRTGPIDLDVYGIDPDYFFSVVPLEGPGSKRIQRYVLDLKRTPSLFEAAKAGVKSALVALGLPHQIFDGFLVVVPGNYGAEEIELRFPC